MHKWFCSRIVKNLANGCLLCVSLVAGGCEGTDTRDTVEELAGKKNVDRYQQMKDDLDEIQTQQAEKYRQLDEHTDDK